MYPQNSVQDEVGEMYLSQTIDGRVLWRVQDQANVIKDTSSTYELALAAITAGISLKEIITQRGLGESLNLQELMETKSLDCPVRHPDAAHMLLTGTGLTHLGSAETRNSMHLEETPEELTDSMKMFRLGLEGGKPAEGASGVQPEWFYKGTGAAAIAPGQAIPSPHFALDGGEEPEIAGIYINGDNGRPYRLGFALSNEFSDHVLESQNYLYLAHSKLRPASFGPEILVGDLPEDIRGMSRIIRNDTTIWEKPFLSGEKNMSHSIRNLEYHHFKYDLFRQPGDVHVHMFGTATLSYADNIEIEENDIFEISSPAFGLPLRNSLEKRQYEEIQVQGL